MADLNVIYRIAADITGLENGVAGAAKSIGRLGTDARKLGTAMLPMSAAITGIGVVALKSAIDFESSFAGIRKTVGDATDSLGNLTDVGKSLATGMRNLAKEIPVSVDELNKIGEAAGQLGIKSENILGFTRVMADLGATTNLSSEEAATSLARLANITQMPQENFDKLGSTIVALGNNLATTESEITAFGLRIAGAGKQIGLSEAQILSIGAALSSVGINAEAGGTAISKVMIDMAASVDAGGERLDMFAKIAGVSAETFAEQFRTNAAGALTTFVTGLGNVEERGLTTLGVLEEMGITEVRMRDALLRASGAGDLLANSIQIGTDAWVENNALTKEAEQRYRTTSSQLTLLWNQFKDVAITLGEALLPVMKTFLSTIKSILPYIERAVGWFSKLSPEIQTGIVVVGGLVAALGPALVALGAITAAISAAMPVIAAIGSALGLLATGPIALVAAAVVGLVTAWYKWDVITEIAMNVYTGVKTWLVDKFQAIVDSIKAKVDAVTGFFKGMYTAVVGQSYVPDMVNGIAQQFGRLGDVMVTPASAAASAISSVFDSMMGFVTSKLQGWMGSMGSIISKFASAVIQHYGGQISSGLTKALGSTLGGAAASAMGVGGSTAAGAATIGGSLALGASTMGVGLAAVGVYKGIKALMGQSEHKKVNDIRDDWFNANGGLKGVNEAAQGAGDSNLHTTQAIFAARTRDDFVSAVEQWESVTSRGIGMATGGLVRQPTLAMIGEAGPEMVIPLDKLGGLGLGQQPIVVQLSVDGRRFMQATAKYLPRTVEQWVGA